MTAVGTAVPRKEDARLLRGQGSYVDNLTATGVVHAVIVRSPYAHAVLKSVDISKAREAPGVVAAFTGADLADGWPGGLPCFWPVSDDIKMVKHLPLATDKARFAGDGVAVVVAETRAASKDAANWSRSTTGRWRPSRTSRLRPPTAPRRSTTTRRAMRRSPGSSSPAIRTRSSRTRP